jgi:hypothetical protein
MKKTLLFKLFTISFLLFGSIGWVNGQALLVENFDYTTGTLLTDNGWTITGTTVTNPITVTAPTISYAGYLSSGIGNEVTLQSSGQDVNKQFAAQTSGSVYASILVNIKTASTTGDYFFHFGQSTIGTTFKGKLFAKSDVSNKLAFGISYGANTGNFTAFNYDLNTTYLIVLKYTFNTATTSDDQVAVFINPVPGNPEPLPTIVNTDTPTEIPNVGCIALRQGTAANTVSSLVDGIRVATTWADAVAAPAADVTAPTFTVTPNNGDINVAVNTPIVLTFDEAIRNIDDSEITDANVAALLTLKETDITGADVPFTATIDAAKKIITATPTTELKNSQVYYAAIIPVEDAANNATTASNMTFTTIASTASTISDVAITETAPYFAGDPITITWVSQNITDVIIEAWIPSQSKWDTLIETTPSDGTESFTIPADAMYSTDYKIRVTDVTNVLVTAESSMFTIIAVANDLVTLRAQPVNAIVKYTGIATVTYARTTRNQKYIQDATAAVLIDDPTTAPGFITGTYNIGDGITNVVGKIALYAGLIEFTPTAPTGEPATGIEIIPEVRTLASLTSDDQCKLVTIEDFAFKTPRQFVKSLTYAIDGYDSLIMAYRTIFAESDYIGGNMPVGTFSSTVLVGQYNTQMQITARSWSDMITPTVAAFSATPTFVIEGESIQFTDLSTNNPTAWEWSFVGGTPATSSDQNPLIKYNADGLYSVTLKVTNAFGDNTITKTDYITIGGVGFSTLPSVVTVYPNPSNGRLFITNPAKESQEVAIFNALGKQVNSAVSAKDVISMDIAAQSKGLYLVRITNKATKSVQFKKIVLN